MKIIMNQVRDAATAIATLKHTVVDSSKIKEIQDQLEQLKIPIILKLAIERKTMCRQMR